MNIPSPHFVNIDELVENINKCSSEMSDDSRIYWERHKKRFRWTLNLLRDTYCNTELNRISPTSILDVGLSHMTLLIQQLFPEAQVSTLGFRDSRYQPSPDSEHIEYDLNNSPDKNTWPKNHGYDLILLLEVIEHLYTSPGQVLRFIKSLLNPGGLLVLSTPNALFLQNRLRLLIGKHPFEMIRESRLNPGHFREYTRNELIDFGRNLNLHQQYVTVNNSNLDLRIARDRQYDFITNLLPIDFRQMITIIFQNSES